MMGLSQGWYEKKKRPLLLLLWPLSIIFRCIVAARRLAYTSGFIPPKKLPVPVVVVGNITVGGTGKTPLVLWLAEFLRKHGYTPGIISRGYKGSAVDFPLEVTEESDVRQVGDEPYLMAQHAICPVVIAPKRIKAAQFLIEHYDCDIIISDDGLQHYSLGRDIEIAVNDALRRFGNNFMLPAGPLREPVKRLQDVDFVVNNGGEFEG